MPCVLSRRVSSSMLRHVSRPLGRWSFPSAAGAKSSQHPRPELDDPLVHCFLRIRAWTSHSEDDRESVFRTRGRYPTSTATGGDALIDMRIFRWTPTTTVLALRPGRRNRWFGMDAERSPGQNTGIDTQYPYTVGTLSLLYTVGYHLD